MIYKLKGKEVHLWELTDDELKMFFDLLRRKGLTKDEFIAESEIYDEAKKRNLELF